MAKKSKKLSDLPVLSIISPTDVVPIVDMSMLPNETKIVTVDTLLNAAIGSVSAVNVGAGSEIIKDVTNGIITARTIKAGANTTATQNANDITIASSFTPVGSNLGSGSQVFKDVSSGIIRHRTLTAGTNVSITQNTDDITVAASFTPVGSNLGSGSQVFKDVSSGTIRHRTLTAGTNVSLIQGTDDITINSSGGGGSSVANVFNVIDYGAVSDYNLSTSTGTDNLAAFQACLSAAKSASGNGHTKIIVSGYFYLSGTLDIHQTITLEGIGMSEPSSGVGAQRSGPGTLLAFPTNCDGLFFHNQGEVSGGSDFSTVRDLDIYCKFQRDGAFPPPQGSHTGNGIVMTCPVYLDKVNVQNFAENGILVSAGNGAQYAGNAGGFQITKCISSSNGMNGFMVEGGDATVGLVSCCSGTVNHGWGFKDTTIATTYVATHGEGNRGFRPDLPNYGEYYIRNGVNTNASIMVGCYSEGINNELDLSTQCIGGDLALKQFQIRQDGSQGISASIGARNAVSGVPLSFENTSGPDTTLIEFGSKADIGVDGIVLNFSTPNLLSDYNFLKWNDGVGWWSIHNSNPVTRRSIQFPTIITNPRAVCPLFENGIFFGSPPEVKTSNYLSQNLTRHTVSDVVPDSGTWELGDIVFNNSGVIGEPCQWICTNAGSFGSLISRTGSVDIGIDPLIVNVNSTSGFERWQYITIAGVNGGDKVQITAIDSGTLTISVYPPCDTTVSGAAINYFIPTLSETGTIGSR